MLLVTFYQIRHAISTKQKHNGNIKKQSLGSQFTQAHSFMTPSVTVVQVCRNVQGSQGAGSEMALGPGAQRLPGPKRHVSGRTDLCFGSE